MATFRKSKKGWRAEVAVLGARGQALYPAREVIDWAKKYRDKN
jgi:hypothetical protein